MVVFLQHKARGSPWTKQGGLRVGRCLCSPGVPMWGISSDGSRGPTHSCVGEKMQSFNPQMLPQGPPRPGAVLSSRCPERHPRMQVCASTLPTMVTVTENPLPLRTDFTWRVWKGFPKETIRKLKTEESAEIDQKERLV